MRLLQKLPFCLFVCLLSLVGLDRLSVSSCLWSFQMYPLYLSYRAPPAVPTDESTNTLQGILETDDGFDSFQQFLRLEFALENIFFWRAVRMFCASESNDWLRKDPNRFLFDFMNQVNEYREYAVHLFTEFEKHCAKQYTDSHSSPHDSVRTERTSSSSSMSTPSLSSSSSISPAPSTQQLSSSSSISSPSILSFNSFDSIDSQIGIDWDESWVHSQLLARAQLLYRTFVAPGEADYEINISGPILRRIQHALKYDKSLSMHGYITFSSPV